MRTLFTILISLVVVFASAQDSNSTKLTAVIFSGISTRNNNLAKVGPLLLLSEIYQTNRTVIPPIGILIDYQFSEKIGIGIESTYTKAEWTQFHPDTGALDLSFSRLRILPVLTYYILQEKYNPFLFEFGATLGVGYRHVKFRMENVENDPWEARLTYFDAERIKVSIKASTFFELFIPLAC